MNDVLSTFKELTEEQRLEAREQARRNLMRRIGAKPTRDKFSDATISEYPAWLSWLVSALIAVVFAAAALVSAFRLYEAGRAHFLASIPDEGRAQIVGVATFLMAEFLVVVTALAYRVFITERAWRRLALVPIGVGMSVAIVGNVAITHPATVWGWLDTLAPPIAVLSVAMIGEHVILAGARRRRENERAYQLALAEWKQATANLEDHPEWRAAYATALREALRRENARGAGARARSEAMAELTPADWRALVGRELDAERWYEDGGEAGRFALTRTGNGNGKGADRNPFALPHASVQDRLDG